MPTRKTAPAVWDRELARLAFSLFIVIFAWALKAVSPETFYAGASYLGADDYGAVLEALGLYAGGEAELTEVFIEEPEKPALTVYAPSEPEKPPLPAEGRIRRDEYGVTISAEPGSPVLAYADGKVTAVGSSVTYGIYVMINHGDGLTAMYAGLGSASVADGDEVRVGDAVGEAGEGGVRFELVRRGEYVPPEEYA